MSTIWQFLFVFCNSTLTYALRRLLTTTSAHMYVDGWEGGKIEHDHTGAIFGIILENAMMCLLDQMQDWRRRSDKDFER